MAGRDITEGIPLNVGNPGLTGFWTNNAEDYDVAIGGMPFFYAITDKDPYIRQTAPYRKDQFDSSAEPGEQSLVGWWLRSQSSFHGGSGIKFYDPSAGEVSAYRFTDSQGVDIFTAGQVTLLKKMVQGYNITGAFTTYNHSNQHLRSIRTSSTNLLLLHDEYDINKINSAGTSTSFINYTAGTNDPIYAICDDGVNAYFVTNLTESAANKLHMFKKPLTGDSTTGLATSPPTNDVTLMFFATGTTMTSGVMEFVKDRIVLCKDNSVYEISPVATSLPTAVYTNPNTNYRYTSITASGPAIYTAGYSGMYSTIQKYTLVTSTGAMPTLSSAIVSAEFPPGEIVYKIFYYLGFMIIGTSKGVRVAKVNDQDGSLAYGPLVVETAQPVYDMCVRDRFVWCTTNINGNPGLTRIDLSNEIGTNTLRFAYANDVQVTTVTGKSTTSCAFLGETNQVAFTTNFSTRGTIVNKVLTSNVATLTTSSAHNITIGSSVIVEGVDATFNGTYTVTDATTTTFSYAKTASNVSSTAVSSSSALVKEDGYTYIQSATNLVDSGYVTTGAIRYGTLEPKNFKFVRARGEYTNGSMDIYTVDSSNNAYTVITYNSSVGTPEAATSAPEGAQEYISMKFILYPKTGDLTLGPTFKGFQLKSLPATKRSRLIQFPVYLFDVEKDRFNVETGYEGRAWERIQTLEDIEADGDIVNYQDFTTGERVQVLIEKMTFERVTPPTGKFDGFGGILTIVVRTVL